MAETTVEKATCENCGVEPRDGTSFCYNCGTPVADVEIAEVPEAAINGTAPAVSTEAQAALDDLAERFRIDEVTEEDKLAQAAAERKRARVVRTRRGEVVWEPVDNTMWFVVFTLLITVLTALVVFIAVYWK